MTDFERDYPWGGNQPLAPAPVATAQGFEQWWQKFNNFSTDSDRLDFTIIVLSAPFEAREAAAYQAWQAARATSPPQPAGTPQPTAQRVTEAMIRSALGCSWTGENYDYAQVAKQINLELAPPPTGRPEPLRELVERAGEETMKEQCQEKYTLPDGRTAEYGMHTFSCVRSAGHEEGLHFDHYGRWLVSGKVQNVVEIEVAHQEMNIRP